MTLAAITIASARIPFELLPLPFARDDCHSARKKNNVANRRQSRKLLATLMQGNLSRTNRQWIVAIISMRGLAFFARLARPRRSVAIHQ